jgi:hypothetical protein
LEPAKLNFFDIEKIKQFFKPFNEQGFRSGQSLNHLHRKNMIFPKSVFLAVHAAAAGDISLR